MGCGCGDKTLATSGAATLRCIDPNGCEINPWGFRAYGETYTLNCGLACDLALAAPERFSVVAGEYDLQAVRGIGPETARALQAMGIMTLTDLITADPREVDAHLDGADVDTIMAWQVQAVSIMEASNG